MEAKGEAGSQEVEGNTQNQSKMEDIKNKFKGQTQQNQSQKVDYKKQVMGDYANYQDSFGSDLNSSFSSADSVPTKYQNYQKEGLSDSQAEEQQRFVQSQYNELVQSYKPNLKKFQEAGKKVMLNVRLKFLLDDADDIQDLEILCKRKYLLEVVDPLHRLGLVLYWDYWLGLLKENKLQDPVDLNFFGWLDRGSGLTVNLPDKPRQKLEKKHVKYFDNNEIEDFAVEVKDNKLVYKKTQEPLNSAGVIKSALGGPTLMFILMYKNKQLKFYAHLKERGTFQHTSLSGGKPILCGGTMSINKGSLKVVNGHSGHYQPSKQNLNTFKNYLKHEGLDTSKVKFFISAEGGIGKAIQVKKKFQTKLKRACGSCFIYNNKVQKQMEDQRQQYFNNLLHLGKLLDIDSEQQNAQIKMENQVTMEKEKEDQKENKQQNQDLKQPSNASEPVHLQDESQLENYYNQIAKNDNKFEDVVKTALMAKGSEKSTQEESSQPEKIQQASTKQTLSQTSQQQDTQKQSPQKEDTQQQDQNQGSNLKQQTENAEGESKEEN